MPVIDRTEEAKALREGRLPACADREDELKAWEIADINAKLPPGQRPLNPERRWFRCTADHGYHCQCGKEFRR